LRAVSVDAVFEAAARVVSALPTVLTSQLVEKSKASTA
jgi:hypothetical protein